MPSTSVKEKFSNVADPDFLVNQMSLQTSNLFEHGNKNLFLGDINHEKNTFLQIISSPAYLDTLQRGDIGVYAYEFPKRFQPYIDKLQKGEMDRDQFIKMQTDFGLTPFHQDKAMARERIELETDMIIGCGKRGIKVVALDNSIGAEDYRELRNTMNPNSMKRAMRIANEFEDEYTEKYGAEAFKELRANRKEFTRVFDNYFYSDPEVLDILDDIKQRRLAGDKALGENLQKMADGHGVAVHYGGMHLKGIKEGLISQTASIAATAPDTDENLVQNFDYKFDTTLGTFAKISEEDAPAPATPKPPEIKTR